MYQQLNAYLGSLLPVVTDYRQISNISRTLVGNKIADHSDVVRVSPYGSGPTTSSFSTKSSLFT